MLEVTYHCSDCILLADQELAGFRRTFSVRTQKTEGVGTLIRQNDRVAWRRSTGIDKVQYGCDAIQCLLVRGLKDERSKEGK